MDTKNYAVDCQALFGHFLHHRRARTADELSEIPSSYSFTKKRYLQRFGVEPPVDIWGVTTEAVSMCGGGGDGLDPSQSGPISTNSTGSAGTSSSRYGETSGARSKEPASWLNILVVIM